MTALPVGIWCCWPTVSKCPGRVWRGFPRRPTSGEVGDLDRVPPHRVRLRDLGSPHPSPEGRPRAAASRRLTRPANRRQPPDELDVSIEGAGGERLGARNSRSWPQVTSSAGPRQQRSPGGVRRTSADPDVAVASCALSARFGTVSATWLWSGRRPRLVLGRRRGRRWCWR